MSGLAYVLNSADTYAFTASKIYTVVPGDNLWKIAERELGSRRPLCGYPCAEWADFQRHPGRHETADPLNGAIRHIFRTSIS